jgi:hypothetical protein
MNQNTVVNLISYGIIGLGAVFAVLAFSSLRREQTLQIPTSRVLRAIHLYLASMNLWKFCGPPGWTVLAMLTFGTLEPVLNFLQK